MKQPFTVANVLEQPTEWPNHFELKVTYMPEYLPLYQFKV